MEHRWGERVSVNVPVRLDVGLPSVAFGFIRDVSLSGAYLETSADLSPWTAVIVELPRGLPGLGEPHRIHALVIRRAARRLALEWSEFASEPIRTLIASANRNTMAEPPAAMERPHAQTALRPSPTA